MLLVTVKDNTKWEKSTNVSQNLKKRVKFSILFSLINALVPNNSISPCKLKSLTELTLPSCDFSETDNVQMINYQDSNKARGHDVISIRMLKLCSEAICRPLNIIFKTFLNTGMFLSGWKIGNVVPIH